MGEPRGYTQSVTISYGPDGVQTFSSSSGNPTVNINNTNNIHMNMGLGRMGHMGRMGNMGREDPFEMMQGLMGGMGRMPGMFVFREGEEQPQSRGVSEEFIDNLPPMKAGKEADCNICLEKVGSNDNKSCELPCGHAFDKSCLSTWLKEHDSCPVCRAKLDQERPQPEPVNEPQQQANPFQSFFGF